MIHAVLVHSGVNYVMSIAWILEKINLVTMAPQCTSHRAKFMGPTWGPSGSCQPQMGPMLTPWTLLSGLLPFLRTWCPCTDNQIRPARLGQGREPTANGTHRRHHWDPHCDPGQHGYGQIMMTSSNGSIFPVTVHLYGEFTGHQWIPLTKTSDAGFFDVFFDLRQRRFGRMSKIIENWMNTAAFGKNGTL